MQFNQVSNSSSLSCTQPNLSPKHATYFPQNSIDLGTIDVVGGGIGCISFLQRTGQNISDMRNTAFSGKINIFTDNGKIGSGYAYSDMNDDDYILNQGLNDLGGELKFFDWVQHDEYLTSHEKSKAQNLTPYPPRRIVGKYLEELGDNAIKGLTNKGIKIEIISKHAVLDDLNLDSNSALVLCEGGLKARPSIYKNEASILGKKYIEDHVRDSKIMLDLAKESSNICILGTGLSAIDVIRSLVKHGSKGKIIAISRRGLLPLVRPNMKFTLPQDMSISKLNSFNKVEYKDIITAIQSDLAHILSEEDKHLSNVLLTPLKLKGYDSDLAFIKRQLEETHNSESVFSKLHSYFSNVDTELNELFVDGKIDPIVQQQIRRDIEPNLATFVSAMPTSSANLIHDAIKKGVLEIKGDISHLKTKNPEALVSLVSSKGVSIADVDMIVNATGSDQLLLNDKLDNESMVSNLINLKKISPYVKEGIYLGGVNFDKNSCLAGTKETAGNDIYVIGQQQKGKYLNMNSIAQVSDSARKAADSLIKRRISS